MMFRLLAAGLLFALAGCTAVSVTAPAEEVQRRAYAHPGPSTLTLYTVINNRSDAGAHTGLLISGAQRVLWDPAGTFYHPHAPERDDVLYGFTPNIEAVYEDYHARETFRIVRQTMVVPREVADRAIRLAEAQGAAGNATCGITTSQILAGLPGFEDFPKSWYPRRIQEAFAAKSGDPGRVIRDDDADDNHGVLIRVTRPAGPEATGG